MSIFKGIAAGAIRAVGGRITNDGYMSASDLQASQDREAARRAQRAEEIKSFIASKQTPQSGVASVSGSLPSKSFDRRLAGYTKPDTNKFDVIAPDYVPPSMQQKEFKALPDAIYTRGVVFADGTGSANAGKPAVRRFNNSQYVGDQSFDLRGFNQTNVPPPPSSLVQPFSQPVQRSANQIFGDLFARQNAVGAPMMFKINK